MVGRLLLTVALILTPSMPMESETTGTDDSYGGHLGNIVTDSRGGRVDLEASYNSVPGGVDGGPVTGLPIGAPVVGGEVGALSSQGPLWELSDCSVIRHPECYLPFPTADPDPADPAAVAAPVVVTLRDIASFRPTVPGNGMEPGGWAVVGLPANFVAAASVEVVSGTLLGQSADVRFSPVGYRWVHSDGAAVEAGTPGASWEVLGQREFTPTATSHVYAASGDYSVELSVVLRAEYRFAGSPWQPIAGTLAVAGAPQRVLVGQFDTVLTQGDCNAYPSAPGC